MGPNNSSLVLPLNKEYRHPKFTVGEKEIDVPLPLMRTPVRFRGSYSPIKDIRSDPYDVRVNLPLTFLQEVGPTFVVPTTSGPTMSLVAV